jgi:ABC-type uncharacterized transport system YnjBCD ATPase subunit
MNPTVMDESNPVAAKEAPALAGSGEKDAAPGAPTVIDIDKVDFFYGQHQALFNIDFKIKKKLVTAFIGPSGCGKSTLLRCLNRMNDLVDGTRIGTGSIKISGVDIYDPSVDVIELRKRVGMVFQKSNPFPKSIYENIVYGLRLQGINNKARLDETVERSLRGAATGCTPARSAFPGASSSGSASRAPSPWSPRSSSWTNRARPSIPSPPSRSRNSSTSSSRTTPSSSSPTTCSRPAVVPTSPRSSTWAA